MMRGSTCALLFALAACDTEAPTRSVAPPSEDPEVLVVQVAQDGTVIIEGHWLLEDDTILARVRTFHTTHPAGRAELRCDPSTLHGRGVRVLELLQQGEVSKVSLR
jgi:biopolymer transport protein ExbD